jgi:hypothetical protein
MDVVLDSNILIADPWVRSNRLRSLLEYLAKTRANLLLLDPVEQEVRANAQRMLAEGVKGVESAIRNAERLGVCGVPAFRASESLAASTVAWETAFKLAMRSSVVTRVALEPGILSEVVRRAASRLPPVRANGRETRDAIIWLGLIQYLRDRKWPNPTAFISGNTEDFAGPDGTCLRPDLLSDLEGVRASFEYFPSIEAFLQRYAEPISHITDEWIKARLEMKVVTGLVVDRLTRTLSPERFFHVSDSDDRDYYEPQYVDQVFDPTIELSDIYVWEVESDAIDVFLDFFVEVEADIECRLTRAPTFRRGVDEDEFRWQRTLSCVGELKVSVAAKIRGDILTLGEIEDIEAL